MPKMVNTKSPLEKKTWTYNALILCVLAATIFSCASNVHAFQSHAVVFLYHRFGEGRYPSTNIRMDQFEEHLKYLEKNGYQVWSLDRIVKYIQDSRPIPDRTVAITIDDAYLSVYTHAYPLLKARGWPFTVFVATQPVDRGFSDIMSWKMMREMKKHGAEFANHSTTHGKLAIKGPNETEGAWLKRLMHEIEHAQKRLERELGITSRLFAYPFGEYTPDFANLVAKLGYVGFGQQSGAIGPYCDLRILPRYPMSEEFANIKQFAIKASTLDFPIRTVSPLNPFLTNEKRPLLKICMAESDALLARLSCYVSKQGKAEIKWLNRKERCFQVRARKPLPPGRSRYNCTVPSSNPGRYYWYSHPWFLMPAGAGTPRDRSGP